MYASFVTQIVRAAVGGSYFIGEAPLAGPLITGPEMGTAMEDPSHAHLAVVPQCKTLTNWSATVLYPSVFVVQFQWPFLRHGSYI